MIERRKISELIVCDEVGVGTFRYGKNDGIIHFSGQMYSCVIYDRNMVRTILKVRGVTF